MARRKASEPTLFRYELEQIEAERHQRWLAEHAEAYEKAKQPPRPLPPIHVSRLKTRAEIAEDRKPR